MRAICVYIGYTKVTTNNWDIKSLVTAKAFLANISWIAKQIITNKILTSCDTWTELCFRSSVLVYDDWQMIKVSTGIIDVVKSEV